MPKEVLKSILGKIPSLRPDLVVDQLGSESAAVRWRYPPNAKHAVKHIVELSVPSDFEKKQFKCIETERNQTRIALSDLKPNTSYQVELYSLPRRKLAAKIDFHTLHGPKDIAPITEWTEPSQTSRHHQHEPQSLDQVKREIKELQTEVDAEFEARKHEQEEFLSSQAMLQADLQKLSATRKVEQALRDSQRTDMKNLELEKQNLDLKRKHELKKHKDLQHLLNVQHATKNRWDSELVELRQKFHLKRNDEEIRKREFASVEQSLTEKLEAASRKVIEIEEMLKTKTDELKSTERSNERLRVLVTKLERHTDIATGLLSTTFNFDDNCWEEKRLIQDFQTDASLEDEWNTTHQALEHRYVAAYQQYESANRALVSAQAKAHAQSKAQAQMFANAFSSSSLSLDSDTAVAPAPVVADLLPSNLFKDEGVNVSNTLSPQVSPSLALKSWTSSRSRDSSIFFSATSSLHHSSSQSFRHSFDLAPLTPLGAAAPGSAPGSAPSNATGGIAEATIGGMNTPSRNAAAYDDELLTPKAISSTNSSPEKFKWSLLGKKQNTASSQPSTTSNFVRRLSFFRKDKQEDRAEEEDP